MTRSPQSLAERFARLVAGPHDADLDLGALINPRQQARVAAWSTRPRQAGMPGAGARRASMPMRRPAATISRRCCSASVDPRRRDCAGGGVRTGAFAVCLRRRGGGDRARQRHRIWPRRRRLDARMARRQHRVAKRVRAGQVFVNGYGAGGGIELPFGGFKQVRPRPREGLRGALRHVGHQDDRLQSWLKAGERMSMRLKDKVAIITGAARASARAWRGASPRRAPRSSSPTSTPRAPSGSPGEIGKAAIAVPTDVSQTIGSRRDGHAP